MFHSSLKPVINQIVVLKETRADEKRVALTPVEVAKLTAKKMSVLIEKSAGTAAGFNDEAYAAAGATLIDVSPQSKIPSHSLILRVKRAAPERECWENNIFTLPCYIMGFLDPYYQNTDHIAAWAEKGIATFSVELLDIPKGDPKNVFDRMSKIAGRIAMDVAIKERQQSFHDAKRVATTPTVAIIGPGSAGIAAAERALECKLSTTVFGGATFAKPLATSPYTYKLAPTLSSEAEQRAFYAKQLSAFDIVITAARKHKQKPPVLIDAKSLEHLPSFAVVADLCQGQGGNVSVSQKDAVVVYSNHRKVTNMSGYPKLDPNRASVEYAAGLFEIVSEFLKLHVDFRLKNSLFANCWLTARGEVNPVLAAINAPKPLVASKL